jgi:hypothetical protein
MPTLLLISSCKKSNNPNNGGNNGAGNGGGNGGFKGQLLPGSITEFINGGDNGLFRGDCKNAHILFYPNGNTIDSAYHVLVLEGNNNPNGQESLQIMLFYKGNLSLDSGFTLLHASNSPNANYSGYGLIAESSSANINNQNEQWETYDTATIQGRLNITAYDTLNENLSGDYKFSAVRFRNGQLYSNAAALWNGTFTTVPIDDLTNPNTPKGPCYNTVGAKLN